MPKVRKVLNGFTAAEVHGITGLSKPMIDYLRREGFLQPAYTSPDNPRGRVRFYSYRDLLIARLIQRLRETGVELRRLKEAVQRIAADDFWADGTDPKNGLEWVVSDGKTVHLLNSDGFLDDLTGSGQRSFAFVVNVGRLQKEVRDQIDEERQSSFSMIVSELRYSKPPAPGRKMTHAARAGN